MNQDINLYSRICWYDFEKKIVCSRWYRGTAATEQAKAACEARWSLVKFWVEKAHTDSLPEVAIQDLIG